MDHVIRVNNKVPSFADVQADVLAALRSWSPKPKVSDAEYRAAVEALFE